MDITVCVSYNMDTVYICEYITGNNVCFSNTVWSILCVCQTHHGRYNMANAVCQYVCQIHYAHYIMYVRHTIDTAGKFSNSLWTLHCVCQTHNIHYNRYAKGIMDTTIYICQMHYG